MANADTHRRYTELGDVEPSNGSIVLRYPDDGQWWILAHANKG